MESDIYSDNSFLANYEDVKFNKIFSSKLNKSDLNLTEYSYNETFNNYHYNDISKLTINENNTDIDLIEADKRIFNDKILNDYKDFEFDDELTFTNEYMLLGPAESNGETIKLNDISNQIKTKIRNLDYLENFKNLNFSNDLITKTSDKNALIFQNKIKFPNQNITDLSNNFMQKKKALNIKKNNSREISPNLDFSEIFKESKKKMILKIQEKLKKDAYNHFREKEEFISNVKLTHASKVNKTTFNKEKLNKQLNLDLKIKMHKSIIKTPEKEAKINFKMINKNFTTLNKTKDNLVQFKSNNAYNKLTTIEKSPFKRKNKVSEIKIFEKNLLNPDRGLNKIPYTNTKQSYYQNETKTNQSFYQKETKNIQNISKITMKNHLDNKNINKTISKTFYSKVHKDFSLSNKYNTNLNNTKINSNKIENPIKNKISKNNFETLVPKINYINLEQAKSSKKDMETIKKSRPNNLAKNISKEQKNISKSLIKKADKNMRKKDESDIIKTDNVDIINTSIFFNEIKDQLKQFENKFSQIHSYFETQKIKREKLKEFYDALNNQNKYYKELFTLITIYYNALHGTGKINKKENLSGFDNINCKSIVFSQPNFASGDINSNKEQIFNYESELKSLEIEYFELEKKFNNLVKNNNRYETTDLNINMESDESLKNKNNKESEIDKMKIEIQSIEQAKMNNHISYKNNKDIIKKLESKIYELNKKLINLQEEKINYINLELKNLNSTILIENNKDIGRKSSKNLNLININSNLKIKQKESIKHCFSNINFQFKFPSIYDSSFRESFLYRKISKSLQLKKYNKIYFQESESKNLSFSFKGGIDHSFISFQDSKNIKKVENKSFIQSNQYFSFDKSLNYKSRNNSKERISKNERYGIENNFSNINKKSILYNSKNDLIENSSLNSSENINNNCSIEENLNKDIIKNPDFFDDFELLDSPDQKLINDKYKNIYKIQSNTEINETNNKNNRFYHSDDNNKTLIVNFHVNINNVNNNFYHNQTDNNYDNEFKSLGNKEDLDIISNNDSNSYQSLELIDNLENTRNTENYNFQFSENKDEILINDREKGITKGLEKLVNKNISTENLNMRRLLKDNIINQLSLQNIFIYSNKQNNINVKSYNNIGYKGLIKDKIKIMHAVDSIKNYLNNKVVEQNLNECYSDYFDCLNNNDKDEIKLENDFYS